MNQKRGCTTILSWISPVSLSRHWRKHVVQTRQLRFKLIKRTESWRCERGERILQPLVSFGCLRAAEVAPLASRLRNEVSRISPGESPPFLSQRLSFTSSKNIETRTDRLPRTTEGKCDPRKAHSMKLRACSHEISIRVNATHARIRKRENLSRNRPLNTGQGIWARFSGIPFPPQ